MSQTRKLAAIMFTDIVGYTILMGKDEAKAFAVLDKSRAIQRLIIEQFNGRWIKELGDGVMASFNNVSDAVHAAIKIQQVCNAAKDFQLRIGIHSGEVVFENDDVFGDGVNIAARIQTFATPGGIWVSEEVHHNVINKNEIDTEFVTTSILKNIKQPVRIYQVKKEGVVSIKPVLASTEKKIYSKIILVSIVALLILLSGYFVFKEFAKVKNENTAATTAAHNDKSVAVLAFVDMSPAKDQEYLSDGLSEDLINLFAKVPFLKVTGRTSSFSFKGKTDDVRAIGKALNVAYVLEGSIQKNEDNLRISAQLVRTLDGIHVWSDQYDRKLKDIFSVQDEISLAILTQIKIKLLDADKEAVLEKYTDNIDAYQLYLQGRYWSNQLSPDAYTKAIDYFKAAIKLDPNYAIAYAGMSFCYFGSWSLFGFPKEQSLVPALAAAQKALALDDQLAESHIAVGMIKFWYEWDFAQAGIELQKAIEISPNNVEGNNQLGAYHMLMGNYSEGHRYIDMAVSLDPLSVFILVCAGSRYLWEGDYQKILYYGTRLKALNSPGSTSWGYSFVALGHLGLGKYKEAIAEMESLQKVSGNSNDGLSILGSAFALKGETSKALEVVEKMKITGSPFCPNYAIARVYADLQQWDQFSQYYHKAIDLREINVLFLKSEIRHYHPEKLQDAEIQKLIQKIGLP